MQKKGLKILEVEPDSVAEEIGLEPGDHILAVNGHEVQDELALQFHLAAEYADLDVQKLRGVQVCVEADLSERPVLGIRVEEFRTKTCNNSCLFCFVNQLPPNARETLRVKDDDYRLSFLHGNYVTLTNLLDRELDRIIEQRLSPLYVSVHATDPALRTRMLGRRKPDDFDRKLRRLIKGGIQIHAQIVLMPGINDGEQLRKTVFDLSELYPGVQSVAIVPLGLSDHGTIRHEFSPVTPAFSRALIRQTQPWQNQFRQATGKTFAYLADEFYIQSRMQIPDTHFYDEFAQIEDGIGMVRNFLDEFEIELRRHRRPHPALKGTLATGKLFYPYLKECFDRFNHKFRSSISVCPVRNRFMGKNITVAGLLGGSDFVKSLKRNNLGNFVIIPQDSLSRLDGILVDDVTPEQISKSLGVHVYPGGRTVHDLFRLLTHLDR